MGVAQRDKYFEVVFEIEGNSDRPWSFSEAYALKSPTFGDTERNQCLYLAAARANFLNNDCTLNTVRVTEWPRKRRSIILNDRPITGAYTVSDKQLGLQGPANITVLSGANNPQAGTVGSITLEAEKDLEINHPQNAMTFYLEGSEFHYATRQLSAIPDLFVHDLRAQGLAEDQKWLFTPPQPPVLTTLPQCKADFYANIKVFWEAVRAFCAIPAQTTPKDPAKRDLCDIERVVFRGIGERPVGPPKKVFRGRAAIPQ